MKSREDWIEEQEKYLAAYDEVRRELLQIPGVVEVGVGIKETDGGLTEEVAFRVYVNEKLPESSLPSEQVIPKTIHGFRTDVIKKRHQIKIIGFNDEDDWKNYSTKVGGIRIGNNVDGGGTGTLGCFCRLTSDGSVVFLSNHHVLFSGEGAAVGAKVGQPDYEKSCCCTCNEIGQVLDGEAGALDCAIGKLKTEVPFFSKIRKIKKADGTTELNGFISGSTAATLNEEVWKIGARTGLTRGTITELVPNLEITPTAEFPRVANRGDSGSVVVRLGGEVVGLLKSIDSATETLGFATPIAAVLSRLGITIIPTDETQEFDVAAFDEDEPELASRLLRDSAFADVAERLQESEGGQLLLQLFAKHRRECLNLVNTHRPVMVIWHRSQGPTFLAALARSAKEPAYRIPDQIEGVTRQQAATRLCAVFETHGSEALRADLLTYSDLLIEAFKNFDTIEEMIGEWQEMMLSVPA